MKLDIHTHCNTTDPADLERFVRLCESLQTRVCIHSAGPRCDHPYPENDVVRQAVAPYREVDTAFGGFRKLVLGSDAYVNPSAPLPAAQDWYTRCLQRVGVPADVVAGIMGATVAGWLGLS